MYFATIDIVGTLQTFGAVIGIGGALIGVVLGALSAKNKITIKDLQSALDGKDRLLATVTQERDSANIAKHEFEFKLSSEQNKFELLKETITQGPSIEKMILQQSDQHKQIMQALANSSESQAKTAASVSDIAIQITSLVRNKQGESNV